MLSCETHHLHEVHRVIFLTAAFSVSAPRFQAAIGVGLLPPSGRRFALPSFPFGLVHEKWKAELQFAKYRTGGMLGQTITKPQLQSLYTLI